jgi:hypothetical protein
MTFPCCTAGPQSSQWEGRGVKTWKHFEIRGSGVARCLHASVKPAKKSSKRTRRSAKVRRVHSIPSRLHAGKED